MSIEVRMVYHSEDGAWWADSDDAPGYYAGAGSLEQLRNRVHEGLEFHFEDSVDISEETVETVIRTCREHNIEIEQKVRHRAAPAIALGSTQLTTSWSRPIRRLPVLVMAIAPQPSTAQKRAMAGY